MVLIILRASYQVVTQRHTFLQIREGKAVGNKPRTSYSVLAFIPRWCCWCPCWLCPEACRHNGRISGHAAVGHCKWINGFSTNWPTHLSIMQMHAGLHQVHANSNFIWFVPSLDHLSFHRVVIKVMQLDHKMKIVEKPSKAFQPLSPPLPELFPNHATFSWLAWPRYWPRES